MWPPVPAVRVTTAATYAKMPVASSDVHRYACTIVARILHWCACRICILVHGVEWDTTATARRCFSLKAQA